MTILLTGGGSGGHITPILAVASRLKEHDETIKLIYVGQKGDGLGDIPKQSPYIDAVYSVRAGKFRRYYNESFWRQLRDINTLLLNIRDAVYVVIGLFQSLRLMRKLKPDVVFVKGGFVGVPVGLAAARYKIPFVTHDSDAIPGLANRIIARWASAHAVALPKEVYREYPAAKTVTTGVPVQWEFAMMTPALQQRYRQELELTPEGKVLCVTGGGLGARRINDAMLVAAPLLLAQFEDLQILHIVGRQHEKAVRHAYDELLPADLAARIRVVGYVSDLYRYSGAADVVVTRAGATALAEFAVQARPCVIVPNPYLTAGHQLKNAAYLARKHAGLMVDEDKLHANPKVLADAVGQLLSNPAKAEKMGHALRGFAHPDAAEQLAMVLLKQTQAQSNETVQEEITT